MSSATSFEQCIGGGGVAVFPSDTVYGLACSPVDAPAIERLYELKDRPPDKAAAVMFFDLEAALSALPELGDQTRVALRRLLPGPLTVLLDNPQRRFPLAGGDGPQTLGLRVVAVPELAGVSLPVLQSSANLSGQPAARRLGDVPESIRKGADLVIDGGELPGVASTVLDMRGFEDGGVDACKVVRQGALTEVELRAALAHQFHFDPNTYFDSVRADVSGYEPLQDAVVAASGAGASSILELGTGTGETAGRLLAHHRGARLVGIDESGPMLAVARAALAGNERVTLHVARLQEPLPPGPFDLVASALTVHHLDGAEKADLFRRVAAVLSPGGRFVLGDVVVPVDPAEVSAPLSRGYDKPDTVADQLRWLAEAGFSARSAWARGDLAVLTADVGDAGPDPPPLLIGGTGRK